MKKSYSFFAALLLSVVSFAQVTPQWVATYNGPVSDDIASDMTIDASGNAYVIGYSFNGTDYDFVTVKYNNLGVQQWAESYSSINGSDIPTAITVSASGNVYVTGTSFNGANNDYTVVAYDNNGNQLWADQVNGPGNDNDAAYAIAASSGDDVFITGSSTTAGNTNYYTIKYNSAGVQQWTATFDGAANNMDLALKVLVDGSGNVYVGGNSNNGADLDFATVKYNSAGVQQWASIYNGPGNFDDFMSSLKLDASGNVYAGGTAYLAPSQGFVTVKYDNSGNEVFVATYSETATSDQVAYAMTIDAGGNIYMTGLSSDGGISSNATVKFNSSGVQQWSTLYTGAVSDHGVAIAVAPGGNVYVTGVTTTVLESDNIVTIKYDSNGAQQWIAFYNGTDNNADAPVGIALDASEKVYVTGQVINTGTSTDYVTLQYFVLPLSATQSQTDLTCNAVCNGTATVVASGGVAPYTYSWTSGGNAATETNLCAGNYTCTITDANADFIDVTFTITEPTALSSVNSQTNISCFGGNNGTATVTVSGGTGAYTYDWNGTPAGDGTNTITGLTAGNYTCTITDANSCVLTETFTITAPTILVGVKSQTNLSCFGGSDGTATVVASGGTPGYTYVWAPFGGTAATATSLVAGVYTVTITDANNCTLQKFYNITQPSPVNTTPGQTDVSCNGLSDGSASAVAFGGTPGYTYSWAPTGGTASVETGLAAGNYTCTITDANGCIFNQQFAITEPAALSSANMQTNVSCNGANDGDAMVMVSGGTAPYTYAWAPGGETTAMISSLAPGTYTCNVTDANSCTLTETFTITEPTVLAVTSSQTDNTCGGGSAGTATVVVSGGTPAYSYSWAPSGGTAATASSLAAGTYTCTITDANSCTATASFTITAPPAITVTSSQTDVTCNGGTNGSASVTASGGTPGYTYAWLPSGGTGATATGLAAGTYTCTITDANACTATESFTITEPTPLAVTSSQTNVSCNAGIDGSATVVVSGGTPGYTYSWSPIGGTGTTASGLSSGTYTCTIGDANGCSTTATFNITAPSGLGTSATQTNVSCFGGNDGSATVNVTGGTPAYTYAWAPSGGTTATATGLTAQGYTVTVTDANGCTITRTYNITSPAAIASTGAQTNVSCSGGSNGSATVSVTGGTPGYTYSWAPAGGTAATATGLTAGNYTCTITDANSCTASATFTITEPTAIAVSSSQVDVSCNGNTDGAAAVVVSGGTPGYTYAWSPSGGTAAIASSLAAGNYTCTVTDANSCTATATFNITEPAILVASASQTNNVCNGGTSGSATISVSGGTPAYSYSWSPGGGTSATASSLAAGTYTCTVTDANGCSTTASVTITEPSAITVVTSQSNISCNGNTDGSASVLASGGTPGYSYLWLPSGGSASTATSLATGTYTCTITDANSCSTTATVNITEPAVISATASQTNVSCNGGANGTATASVSGGTPGYTYSWFPSGGFAATATGLSAGNYTCTITDANSCMTTVSVTITEPSAITFTASQTDVTCGGNADGTATVVVSGGTPSYTYAWTPTGGTAATATGLTAGNYTCTITDANACTTNATFTITEPAAITASTSQSNVTCNGNTDGSASVVVSGGTPAYTYAWSPTGGSAATASALSAGNYTCTITDATSCMLNVTFTITEPAVITSVNSQSNVSCNGGNDGTATVLVSGGTPAYTYSWAPAGGTAAVATGLAAGTYTCTITDANSCTATETFTITEPSSVTFTSSQTDVTCFGSGNGTATVVASGGVAPYTYAWTPSGGNAATASSLTPGSYSCFISDSNGCSAMATFTINEPSALLISASQIDNTCNGGSTGSATVVVSGGTPGYTYSWSPSGGTGATATGLTAGSYTCTATDANGCTVTASVTITEPSAITATTSQTNISCNGNTDGSASVFAAGGTPGYTYSWSPSGGTASTATGLATGTYTCTITDANACSATATVTITEPAVLAAATSQTNVSCNGANNGTATVTVSGGTPAYTYLWAPSGGSAATATGLAPGTYTCTITDANSCTTSATFTITEPAPLAASNSQTDVSCFGGSNGTATVTVSGGTPAYTYAWAPTGGTAATATGLTAGNYTCTITDANGCFTTASFTLTSPSAITFTSSQTNISCNAGNNGSATVVVSGGTPSYTYAWSPSGGTAATASSLTAGAYTCTITDANSCTATATFTITQPAAIVAVQSQTNVFCNGGSTGSATVTVSGGTPGYTYSWSPSGGTGATATGLAVGNYTCTITDANSCTATATFTITQPTLITATSSQTNVSCNGGSNGTATVVASGGTPGYTYSWAPTGGNAATASGLTAGNYTCTITDANTCTTTVTFNITAPSAITFTSSQVNVTCNGGNNGSATVVVSGGTPSYTYAWAPTGGTAATASSLTAGTYTCTITDANSCTATATFNITQTTAIAVVSSQTNVSCNGGSNGTATVVASGGTPAYTYAWAPTGGTAATATGLAPGTYTCTITDANSCTGTATFNITQPTPLAVSNSQTNVSCFGGSNGTATVAVSGGTPAYTYAWAPTGGTAATATGLTAGTYTCTITDANACTTTATFSITAPTAIAFTSSQVNVSCNTGNNGSATVVVSGGTPSYTYAWSPSGGNAATASSLTAGTYTCTITDANACTATATFTITQPSAIAVTASQTNVSCFGGSNGSATVTATGGTPSYTYAWAPTGGTAPTATGLTAGTYTCTITDANGCIKTQSFNIVQPTLLTATISSVNATCFGSTNGQATMLVSGGTAGYSYAWAPTGGTSMSEFNLAAGTYTCVATDANGCTVTASVNITSPPAITTTATQTDLLCFGATNGSAGVVASGGVPNYTYLWMPGGATSATVNGLAAGSYTCTITDANGCTLAQGFNITQPPMLVATVTSTNVVCQGGGDGTAQVSVTGGVLDYNFSWSPVGGTDSIATGLSAGTYTCSITDANGCALSSTVSIAEPSPINVIPTHTNVTCFGGSNGTADVIVSGGFAPYTYAWSPSGGNASGAVNLTAGTYTCMITDAGGCAVSQTITIVSPAALTATTSQSNVSCNGGSNGTATIIVNGGSPFYTYNWSPSGGTSPVASGLSQGTYTCDVTDANGCTMSQTFLITEPAVLSATISSVNTNCGQNNGSATIVPSGGTMPYAYNWSPTGGNNDTASAILAGNYTCTVTDAHGCSASYSVTVNDTPAPTLALVSQTNILCNGNNTGDATMLASGGVGTYAYAWMPSGGNAAMADTLLAGTYTCTVTDSAGCSATQTVSITEPTLLTAAATSTAIMCNGDSTTITVVASGGVSPYTGEGTFTDTAGTYSYIITDANGCTTTASITVTEPAPLAISLTSTAILCSGGTSTVMVSATGGTMPYAGTGSFIQPAGTYNYIVTDTNGCSDSITSYMITEPTPLVVSSSATSILCNGGNATATVVASGGTTPYSGDGSFTELAGTYTYIVTDSNGCMDSTTVMISEPALLVAVVDSAINPTGCSATDGMIYVSVNGGTTAYSYLWNNSAVIEDLTGLAAGSYSCTITDANGCTTTASATLTDPAPPVVTVALDTVLCLENGPYLLTEGMPAGGTWSGASVSGNTFDPSIGIGAYVLSYTFTAPNGCTATASDTMMVDDCIGIEEHSSAAVWSVFPNPSFGSFTLTTNGNDNEDHLVEVYSSEGKLIFTKQFAAGSLVQVDMIGEAAGIYMVRIASETQVSTLRVIKQ